MVTGNQNKAPRSPPAKRRGTAVDVSLDKRGKIGAGRTTGRQPLVEANHKKDVSGTSDMEGAKASENAGVVFGKEEVEALLNEVLKLKKLDAKGNMQLMADYSKRLKLGLKWSFQEQEKLQTELESSRKKCVDTETEMERKVLDLNSFLLNLKNENAALDEKLAKESSEKLDALNLHRLEKEARVVAERFQASLSEDLENIRNEKLAADKQVISLSETYKRLQEYNTSLQQYNSKLQTDLSAVNESLTKVEKEKLTVVENLSTLRGHYNSLHEQLISSRASLDEAVNQKKSLEDEVKCLREELQKVREDRDRQIVQVQGLTADILRRKEVTEKSIIDLENLAAKSQALQERCSSQAEQICVLHHQLATANDKLKMTDLSVIESKSKHEEYEKTISELRSNLADMEQQLINGEKLRKKLHNTILELKGNIRVFCRVRPSLPDDGVASEVIVSYPTATESLGRGIDLIQSGQKYPFTFDKVFNHEASQEDVFLEISQLVQSALDGYKVCIFAYGQTGSGKTYTMMGKPDRRGLIPRSLEQIFQTSQALTAQGWKYKLQASMLEIYNETIRDLLLPKSSNMMDVVRNESGVAGRQYAIKHDSDGNTHVSDLTLVDVCSVREISSLLEQASQSRSVGKTQMNEQSSRSHFVFTLRIFGVNESTEQQVQGVLNLIDLAGSERLSRSGATGDRLKETQSINKSLSALADVIFALAKKEDHVPFRNSKLTYLLQPCLGGDSKTLMFVNISPESSSSGESLCSLRFAARVNACEIGIPRRQTAMRPLDSRLSYG
ncbi:hypothetical protein SAY87_002512 [Trapa incisa]|uniref:Kinesin-like protein n=1 Tax=Trapa incisa TaxID=236973 RepID=A0AAN7JU73_9MYRT|nr:hypothetical protein SAY87_002512 [Trapa incisa]